MKNLLGFASFRSLSVVIFASAAACSSSTASGAAAGSGSVTGTVKSAPLAVQSAIAFPKAVGVSGAQGLEIFIADKGNSCSAVHLQGSTGLSFDIAASPVAAGSYAVVDPILQPAAAGQAEADFSTADATCKSPIAETAMTGTLTVASSDASHVAGSFDVTFPDGHVTGSFDADLCATIGGSSDGASGACSP